VKPLHLENGSEEGLKPNQKLGASFGGEITASSILLSTLCFCYVQNPANGSVDRIGAEGLLEIARLGKSSSQSLDELAVDQESADGLHDLGSDDIADWGWY
jgi:hypothetical protein